jgi:hypothetical protein
MVIEGFRVVHTQVKIFWDVILFIQQVNCQTTQHLMPEDHYVKEKTT